MTRKAFLVRNHMNRTYSDNQLNTTLPACEITLSHIVVGFGHLVSVGYSPSGIRFEFKTVGVTIRVFDQVDVY